PAYFAPEVARGELRDAAADVFSLGSTLYAAVEGEPPFGLDDNTLALLRTVAEGQVRPPLQAGRLSALLMSMLRDDPAQRPSMSDAVLALGAVAGGAGRTRSVRRPPVHPTPTSVDLFAAPVQEAPLPDGAARDPTRRHAVLLGILASVVVLLGVFTLVSEAVRGRQAADVPEPPAATALAPAPPGPAELEQTVRAYYGLLPGDVAAAWELLGAPERAKSGSFADYAQFWSDIERVGIRGALAVSGDTVQVNLQFELKNRQQSFERYRLTMSAASDGRILIESASRIGTFTPSAAEGDDATGNSGRRQGG
ncbi:MAG: protein kinase domain-containing protein, partial [Actinomycetes bacterium]